MTSDGTSSVATLPNYKHAVSVRSISSTEFEMKCVSQTVDINRLNLGSSYSEMDEPCLNSSNGTEGSVRFRRTRYQFLLHNS
jgi:hypothetical protein